MRQDVNYQIQHRFIGLAMASSLWMISTGISEAATTKSAASSEQQVIAHTASYQLTINPEKCVSLRQGQLCYTDLELTWSSPAAGNYCIFASSQEEPLRCWNAQQTGEYKAEFANDENTQFFLRKGEQIMAQVELKMAWVYKRKRSPSSWRVF